MEKTVAGGVRRFLLYGMIVLLMGIGVYVAIQTLSIVYQLPLLLAAFSALILFSRRILRLEGSFISRSESWRMQLEKFGEDNK